MSFVSNFVAGFREYFTLDHARKTVTAYPPGRRELVADYVSAGNDRLRAARDISVGAAGAVLARDALVFHLRSRAMARDDAMAPADVDLTAELDELSRITSLTADEIAAAREAVSSADPLHFDKLEATVLQRLRETLDHLADTASSTVETRSVRRLTIVRWVRTVVFIFIAAYVLVHTARAIFTPKNLARDKHTSASSIRFGTPSGKELVDGNTSAPFGIHTNTEENPWVAVDLEKSYRIRSIHVYNRTDGWFDDSLPLIAEVSEDGNQWAEVARREEHFSHDPPWIIDAHDTRGRYVRLRIAKHGYIALGEVEVFGSP